MKKIATFFTAVIISASAFAQIPNAGFESWNNTAGYNNPDGWDNLNAVTAGGSIYGCTQGSPGNPGSYFIKLFSQTYGSKVVPGIAVSGTLDTTGGVYTPKAGFPFTQRPAKLTGSWQYMAAGTDQGYIDVLLSKWNMSTHKRDTIAYVRQSLMDMKMSWASFSIDLGYRSTAHPDSAMIVLSASDLSNPAASSYLYVDDLAFSGSVPDAVATVSKNTFITSIYPNPAKGTAYISFNCSANSNVTINVNDLNGRTVKQAVSKASSGNNAYSLNTTDIAKGMYFVTISDGADSHTEKLVIE